MEAQRTLKWLQRTGGVSHLVENSANQKYNGTPQEKSQIPPKQLLQVSSHRVLLKKGAICWGHPMSSHGVLGGKTGAISPRHLTPVSVLSPPPADTWDKLINTRHQHRHDRHNMDFLGNHKPADKKVGVWIAPSHEYLQKVAQSKVIQSKSWQQLRFVRSQVNKVSVMWAEHFHTRTCISAILCYDIMTKTLEGRTIGEPLKENFGKSWEFGPRRGPPKGGFQKPFYGLPKTRVEQ